VAAHQGAAAAGEFQKILDHPGVAVNEPIGALAHLGLGRAYAFEAGRGEAMPRPGRPTGSPYSPRLSPKLAQLTRTSLPSGKTPTPTSPSLSKRRRNMPSCSRMPGQPNLQRLVPMDGNRNANHTFRLSVDVVAAMNAEQRPAVPFEGAGELFARNRLHTAISSTLSLPVDLSWSMSTERHPSTAS